MPPRLKNRYFIWISVILALQFSGALAKTSVQSGYSRVGFFYSEKMTSVICLPPGLIIENSESVFVDGKLLEPERQYKFDAENNVVFFTEPVAETSFVEIRFAHSPYAFKQEYSLRDVRKSWGNKVDKDRKQASVVSDAHPRKNSQSHGIRVSGIKSIRIETSSISGFNVSQALDLKITGSAGAAQVKGRLSDRDMVTGNSGASSRLRDLDRIFLEVSSRDASVRIGDIEISENRGELLAIRREAAGIHAKIGSESRGLVVSGSARRNIEKTAVMEAKEGLSGPYVIPASDQGYRAIVSNSEKVYLDGRHLRRGEANDYTIDYDRGLIFFSPRMVLKEGSRIVVTYEIESDNAEEIYYIGTDFAVRRGLKISSTYATRTTSGEASVTPIDTTLSLIWVDGGKHVGQGLGDYVKVTGDTATYYKYVGIGQGDYQVRFTKIGEGRGKYIEIEDGNSNRIVYLYTGNGAYIDKVPMIPPTRQNLLHFSGKFDPSERIRVACELAKVEGENTGSSGSGKPSYMLSVGTRNHLPDLGRVSLGEVEVSARRLVTQSDYSEFRERRSAEFFEKWKRDLLSGRVSQEVDLTYRLHDIAFFSAGMGKLESASGTSKRQDFNGSISVSGTSLSFELDRVMLGSDGREGNYHSDSECLNIPLGTYKLSIERKGEAREHGDDSLWLRSEEYRAGFERIASNLKTRLSLIRIGEERHSNLKWVSYRKTSLAELALSASLSRKLDVKANVIYRLNQYEPWTMMGKNSSLATELHFDLTDVGVLSEAKLDYSLTRRLSSLFQSELVRTTGVGDYDSLGNHIPGGGNFSLGYKEVGKRPVACAALAGNLNFGRKGRLLPKNSITGRSSFRIESEIDASGYSEAVLMYGAFSKNALHSSSEFSQDLAYRRSNGFSLRFNGSFSRLWDGRCIDRDQLRTRVELGGQIRWPSSKAAAIVFELRNQVTKRKMISGDLTSSSNQKNMMARLGIEYNPDAIFQASINTELCHSEMDSPTTESLTARFSPTMVIQSNGVRLTNSFSIRRLINAGHPASPIFGRDSFELNTRADIRRSQTFWISIEYSLVKMSGIESIQTMRSSFNASF